MVMIKDNHIQGAGGITNAVNAVRKKVPKSIKIEVIAVKTISFKKGLNLILRKFTISTLKPWNYSHLITITLIFFISNH